MLIFTQAQLNRRRKFQKKNVQVIIRIHAINEQNERTNEQTRISKQKRDNI